MMMRAINFTFTGPLRWFLLGVGLLLLLECKGGGDGAGVAPSLELFAGNVRVWGNGDGIGTAARFDSPVGLATDGAGNIYVADSYKHTIRKMTPAGDVTTLAGKAGWSGNADGNGAEARFDFPTGVATDSSGNVYVADNHNCSVRKITQAGDVSTLAAFLCPESVATDSRGNVFVADSSNCSIRKITPAGDVSTFAGSSFDCGSTDGTGSVARFNRPLSIASDGADNLYVADTFNGAIRRITPAGVVSTLTGSFYYPRSVTPDGSGNVYVGDNNTILKIIPAGDVSTLAGAAGVFGSADGTGSAARFSSPGGLATDGAGNVYVADTDNNTIRSITSSGIVSTIAGMAGTAGLVDGAGSSARFDRPNGIVTDSAGNVYVADTDNSAIRKITQDAVVTTITASFASLNLAVDSAGNFYVSNLCVIYQITPAGVISLYAGTLPTNGVGPGSPSDDGCGYRDGIWSVARFGVPGGLVTDSTGNVYVADTTNNIIRKITPAGMVSTLAGMAGWTGSDDGIGSAARFNKPLGIAIDSAGTIYVADAGNYIIRKITPDGNVTTLAGTPGMRGSFDGTGADARFDSPNGIAVDDAGNIYVADTGNSTIRRVTPAGVVSTVVGVVNQVDFQAGALPGLVSYPIGVAVSGTSLYITLENGVVVVRNLQGISR